MDQIEHRLRVSEEHAGLRLDAALARLLPEYSRSRIKQWILHGEVTLDGARVSPRTAVSAGQTIVVLAKLNAVAETTAEPIQLDVVFADDDIIIINKPVGLIVHPGAGNPAGTLVNGLLHQWPELERLPRAGLVHRLDKDTTGLLVCARSLPAHTQLVRALQDRLIEREYRAVCLGSMTAGGCFDAPIGRHATHRTRMTVRPDGREAVTHYRVLLRFTAHSLVAVRLETGRTHQIRVHFADAGHPLVGDAAYGGRNRIPGGLSADQRDAVAQFNRQALHASRLALDHPVSGERLTFSAPMPPDLRRLVESLTDQPADSLQLDELEWPTPAT